MCTPGYVSAAPHAKVAGYACSMTITPAPQHRSDAEQAKLDAAQIELFENKVTFNRLLGLRVLRLRPQMQVGFAMRPELVGHYHYQRLHGGVISATLDALGGSALLVAIIDQHPNEPADVAMARFVKLGTIDLRVDYLRPGLGKNFTATAEITRLGGRVGSTQCRLHNDEGVLIATAAAAYIVS